MRFGYLKLSIFAGLSDSTSETSYKKIGVDTDNNDNFHIFDYDDYDAQIFKLPNKTLTQWESFVHFINCNFDLNECQYLKK